jgi:hypothetical protein
MTDTLTSPAIVAFLRGFADHAEKHDFGQYHAPEPEMTFDRPPYILTPEQFMDAKTRGTMAKIDHQWRVAEALTAQRLSVPQGSL